MHLKVYWTKSKLYLKLFLKVHKIVINEYYFTGFSKLLYVFKDIFMTVNNGKNTFCEWEIKGQQILPVAFSLVNSKFTGM